MTQERKAELSEAIPKIKRWTLVDKGAEILGVRPPAKGECLAMYWRDIMHDLGVPKRFWPDTEPLKPIIVLQRWLLDGFPSD
jgi:hypothetical protein